MKNLIRKLIKLKIKTKLILFFVMVNVIYLSIIGIQFNKTINLVKYNQILKDNFPDIDILKAKLSKLDVSQYPLIGGNIKELKEKLDRGELTNLSQYTKLLPDSKDAMWQTENLLKHGLTRYGLVYPEFISPLEITEAVVTAEYGSDTLLLWDKDKKNIYSYERDHSGTDMDNPKNKNVYAAASGKVVSVKYDDPYYGKCVYIMHCINGQWKRTLYGHLSIIYVQPGQIIDQADIVGREGNTGFSLGEHLHFELQSLQNGVWVSENPFRNCIIHRTLGTKNYFVYM